MFYRTKIRLGEHEISNRGIDCDIKNVCNEGSQDFDIENNDKHEKYGTKKKTKKFFFLQISF